MAGVKINIHTFPVSQFAHRDTAWAKAPLKCSWLLMFENYYRAGICRTLQTMSRGGYLKEECKRGGFVVC